MKMKLILSAALVAGVISASAATQPVVTPAETNSNPEAAMKALFGDPVIVKAKGFEIKQSELDQVLTGVKAAAAARGQQVPPAYSVAILNQLITIDALSQKATDADRAAGKAEADDQYAKLLTQFGSQEALERQLKAVGMTVADLRAKGYTCTDPSKAVQPGAKIATIKGGTSGVPFAVIQYNAIPIEEPA